MELLKNFLNPKAYKGVFVRFMPGGSLEIKELVLERKKDKISVQQASEKFYDNPAVFYENLSKDLPIAFIFDGKGFIHKKLDKAIEGPAVLGNVLSGANPNDFYIQSIVSGSSRLNTVCRKDRVDEFLKELNTRGLLVGFVGFGPGSLFAFPALCPESGKAQLGEYSVQFSEHQAVSFNFEAPAQDPPYPTVFDPQDVNPSYSVPFLAALNGLSHRENEYLTIDSVQENRKEIIQKNIFDKIKLLLPVALLVLLLVNFLLYSHYSEQQNELSLLETSNTGLLQKLTELKTEVDDKQAFLKSAGWEGDTKFSFYADRFASQLPANIRLTEMTFDPLNEKKSKELRKPVFERGYMLVTGVCKNSFDFNSWIKKIEADSIFKNVSIIKYQFDKKEQEAKFELNVFYE